MSAVTICDGCDEAIPERAVRCLELEVKTAVRMMEDPEGPLHFHDEECLRRWLGVPFHRDECRRGGTTFWSADLDGCICLLGVRDGD